MFVYILLTVFVLGVLRHLTTRRRLPPGTKWPPGPRGTSPRSTTPHPIPLKDSHLQYIIHSSNKTPGIPLIGHVWDIPRSHSYKRFKAWSDAHGPMYSINIFGINHIWLSSDKIANDLLSRRATKHSDRPSINQLLESKEAPEYLPLLGYNGTST